MVCGVGREEHHENQGGRNQGALQVAQNPQEHGRKPCRGVLIKQVYDTTGVPGACLDTVGKNVDWLQPLRKVV